MRPDIPWNVAGIPFEAREAARAAARREGLSLGEWMTRRILQGFSGGSDDTASTGESWSGSGTDPVVVAEAQTSRRETEDMLAHVARSETESGEVFRRIEEQLRGVARRLEAAERSQSENNRAMSKAANEINIAAREQAQAFDQLGNSVIGLADRIDRVERTTGHDGLRDAVKGLHQGLSRLADQISTTANQSATQISALANNLESVAGRAGQTRNETEAATRAFEQRITQLDERVRSVERLVQASQDTIQNALSGLEARKDEDAAASRRASETALATTRLEDTVAKLGTHNADPALDRRLSSIEHSVSEIANRFDRRSERPAQSAAGMNQLAQRIEALEKTAAHSMRAGNPPAAAPPLASGADARPMPDRAVPDNAPPLQVSDAPFAAVADDTTEPHDSDAALGSAALGNAGILHEPMHPPASASDTKRESFLFAARRSARSASAQAEVERGFRGGGFNWAPASASVNLEPEQDFKRTYLWIAIIALLAIAAVGAGVILSQRLGSASPHAIGVLFSKEQVTGTATTPSRTDVRTPTATRGAASASPPQLTTVVVPAEPAGTIGDSAKPNAGITTSTAAPAANAVAVKPPATVPPAGVPPTASHAAPASANVPLAHGTPTASPPPVLHPAQLSPLDKLTALANAGNAKAELLVGLKYLDGDGVPINETDAAKWLARAADKGEAVAQYRLGTMFERGRGVAADAAKAVHWYTLAAQAGNRKAMHNLAVAYASGTGLAKNLAEAARWFSRAAALGLSDSQFNLAVLYERGLGVPQSLLDAYKWYAIAAATGDAESKARTDALATQLSADDRAAAQHAAHAFHAQPLDVKANVAPLLSDITG